MKDMRIKAREEGKERQKKQIKRISDYLSCPTNHACTEK